MKRKRTYAIENPLSSAAKAGGIILAGTGTGAAIGIAFNKPCNANPQDLLGNLFCGPLFGGLIGGSVGMLVTTVGAIATAAVTKNETAKNAAIIGGIVMGSVYILSLANKIANSVGTTQPAQVQPAPPPPAPAP